MKTEKELSEEMGLDRKHLIRMRKEGLKGWHRKGNTVMYDSDGEHAVRNVVQKELCVSELSEPLPDPVEKEMVVTNIPFNSRMVICGDVRVKVHSNQNFKRGMKLRARPPLTNDSKLWVLVGRSPRWKGKW
jgi:hypothetical protein